MTNCEIICNSLSFDLDNLEKIKKDNCFLCGKEITEGVKKKTVLSGNFTNFDICKNLEGEYFCKECCYCIKNADLRKNNIIACKNKLYLLKKNDLENYLFNLDKFVEGEFIVCVTQSFKKHNVIRAKVNTSTSKFYIRMEDDEFLFNVPVSKEVYDKLNEAYLFFTKEELESGDYKIYNIEKFGLSKFYKCEEIFKKYRGTSQFSFLIYILNSERRNEILKERLAIEKENKKKGKKNEK